MAIRKQLFAELDKDGGGDVDYRELHKAVAFHSNPRLRRRMADGEENTKAHGARERQRARRRQLAKEARLRAQDEKRKKRLARLERAIQRSGGRVLDPVAAAIKTQCDLARTRVKDVFAAFDADGSGTVDRNELRNGVKPVPISHR